MKDTLDCLSNRQQIIVFGKRQNLSSICQEIKPTSHKLVLPKDTGCAIVFSQGTDNRANQIREFVVGHGESNLAPKEFRLGNLRWRQLFNPKP